MHCVLRENIDWVGYVDWHVRDFHSFHTARGATYNAYLLRDEQTALIDTVKAPYGGVLLANIAELTPLDTVRWVVCNHAEPDHAGALAEVMAALPNATLVCDKKCQQTLGMYFDISGWKIHIVGTGDTLSLGARTLQFIQTPFAHWPESMCTYVVEEKVLFSMDAFGQHLATSQRFDDDTSLETLIEEARTYYANIIMPYGPATGKAMAAVEKLDLEMIAPAHGVIWRRHVDAIIEAYRGWISGRPKPKVLVIYDSMWESTAQMAQAIYEGAIRPGVEVQLIPIRRSDLTRIASEVLDAAALAFGSATLNTGMMPMAGAVTTYLSGLRPAGKAAFAFGSYGWSRGGAEALHEFIESLSWEVVRPPLRAQYRPAPAILEECRAGGALLAEKALTLSAGDLDQAEV